MELIQDIDPHFSSEWQPLALDEVLEEHFGRATEYFMVAVGKDNIFNVDSTSSKKDKKRVFRQSMDNIVQQLLLM